ncbi:hypothetical protein [Natronoflexus pectinivorans]|uniref:Uncharacterized protein n=1 Tax=Natronoflexus pectinivorans TaxID=682526 RepID=A0A4R2GLP3_9BACT|nr:hypothetical protein [Natronoflexus pectinivorans]TCO08411.1 hypothetical protein EV194_105217 [Natronoflexus pectinivorans]
MRNSRKIKTFFVLLALPMVLWLYYNHLTNWHYHLTDNGMVVKHAHPYNSNTLPGTPWQNHHHSNAEFFLLAMLSITATLLVFLLALSLVYQFLYSRLRSYKSLFIFNKGYSITNHMRGPPSISPTLNG